MTTGCLMESSFVHMSGRTVGNVDVYHCTCTLFATLLQLATLDEQPDTEIDSINIKCCHIRPQNLWMNVNDITDIEDEDEEAFIDNEEDENDLEDTNQPETTQTQRTNFFNPATGLWDFPSLSEHRPKEEDDPALQRAIKKRLVVFDGAEGVFRDSKGYLTGNNPLVLFPPVLEDGCLCGAGYSDDDHPNGVLTEVKYRTVVYLTNGPARFEVRMLSKSSAI
ncbi:unnamed protein product [Mytilus coruscus]|uniref:Uncharacterized protein n=1 Tax=Mytilus coruscus TaxID=42192 RepID=A0A6J8A933_MYTCO|nr:unnamed protein product [Mytilus coruscus]